MFTGSLGGFIFVQHVYWHFNCGMAALMQTHDTKFCVLGPAVHEQYSDRAAGKAIRRTEVLFMAAGQPNINVESQVLSDELEVCIV